MAKTLKLERFNRLYPGRRDRPVPVKNKNEQGLRLVRIIDAVTHEVLTLTERVWTKE